MSLVNAISLRARVPLAAIMALLWFAQFGVPNTAADTIGGPVNWGAGEGPAGDYDFPSEDCTGNHTDPVGVLFVGKRAGVNNVTDQVEYHAHWASGVGNLNPHSLLVRGADGKLQCHTQNYANANAGDASDRFHVRLWNIPGSVVPMKETVGTPHHEDWVFGDSCFTHAVDPNGSVGTQGKSGFDWGRHKLRYWFSEAPAGVGQPAGNHEVETESWGNNSNFKQCNGKFAGSDGSGLIIWVNNEATAETGQPTTSATLSTLHGTLNTGEAMTEYWFGYGSHSAQGEAVYPHKTTVRTVEEPGSKNVDEPLTDLAPNRTYYVRMFVRNEDGDVEEGNEQAFTTPPPIPVAAYSFDEGEGGTVDDLTGHGHTATIKGAQWTTKGRYGGAMEFDVADQEDVLKVPDTNDLDLTEDFTLEAWVRPSSVRDWATVIGKEDEEESSFSYLFYSQSVSGGPGGALRTASKSTEEYAEDALPIEAWSHISLTSDGSKARLYVDGVLVETSESFPLHATDGDLSIGGNGIWGEYFDGRIDEVRIYDRTLSPAEIEADRVTPLQTPLSGPIAAYSFDEGEGTSSEDLTGHGHTATIEEGEWARGKYGEALKFDGGTKCLSIADAPDLRLSEEFTLEAWVRPLGGVYDDPVIVKESEGKTSYGLGLGSRVEGMAEGFIGQGKGSRAAIADDEAREYAWTHIASTYDGATLRVYVDGELSGSEAAPNSPATGGGALKIGCDIPDGQFTGGIDEARIYDRALDAAEVQADRSAPLQTPQADPVAAYSFDEGEGETAGDLSGNGHTATIEGAQWTPNGRYGAALEFDSSAEDVLKVPDSPQLDFSEEFTLEAWVRPSGEDNHSAPLIDKQQSGGVGYFLYEGGSVSDRPVGAASKEQEIIHADEPLDTHAWSHVALTFNGNRTFLYVNGELIDNGAAEPIATSEGDLEIGGSTETGEYFDGQIDEVRIYDRALDDGEVQADKAAPIQTPQQDPIAAFSFDEGEGTIAEDLTGDGHTATIEGAEWTRGRFGSSLRFDGEDMASIPAEELDLIEEFTLEAWVKPEYEGEYGHLFVKEEASEEHAAYVITKHGSRLAAHLGIPGIEEESSSGALELGAWQHVAITYDGALVRLYVDGELVGTHPVAEILSTDGALRIGGSEIWGSGDGFKGRIDEVRVYNRALSEGEVVLDRGVALETPSEGPVAAYSFDEGEGTTVEDLTGHGHTATIEGAAWTTRGHFGNALEFKGEEGECVTIPDSEQLSLDEEMTVEAWVKPSNPLEDDPILYKDANGMIGYSIGIGTLHADRPEGWLGEGSSSFEDVVGPESLEANVWAHIAMTYDGANMRLYVNGELVDTAVPTAGPSTSGGDLRIGCNPNYPEVFKGRIDEVRIYNRALNAQEF